MNSKSETKLTNYRKTMIFCPNCKKIPLVTILSTTPIKAKVICSCETRIVDINTYINEIRYNYMSIPSKNCQSNNHNSKVAISYCKTCHKDLCYECLIIHNQRHSIYPADINCDIIKHNQHNKFLAFCYDCFNHICTKCDKDKHKDHCIMYLDQIKYTCFRQRIKEHKKVYKNYKTILGNTRQKVIDELYSAIKRINESYAKCIKKNNQIMQLITLIVNNAILFSAYGKHYQSKVNLFDNTNFTIYDNTYTQLPILNTTSDTIKFFNEFSIIKTNNVYDLKYKQKERIIPIDTTSKITTLAVCNDKVHLIMGKENGEIGIFNIETNRFTNDFFPAHDNAINGIVILSDTSFSSSSEDSKVKIWTLQKNNDRLCYYLHKTYNGDKGSSFLVNLIKDNRIAFCTRTGKLMIYSLDNDTLLMNEYIYEKENTNFSSLLIYNKYHDCLVVNTNDSETFFYCSKDTLYKKSEKVIKDLYIYTVHTYLITSNGKLIGLAKISKDNNVYLVVVNVETKDIESIANFNEPFTTNYYLMGLFFYSENQILARFSTQNIIMFDCNSFQISSLLPLKLNMNDIQAIFQCKPHLYILIDKSNRIIINQLYNI